MSAIPIASTVAPSSLSLEEFAADPPYGDVRGGPSAVVEGEGADAIDGVVVAPLAVRGDARGSLRELLSAREGPIEPVEHVYLVRAASGSVRAWVLHRRQTDRLAFTEGEFEVVLYDIRPGSPSAGRLDVLRPGEMAPALIRIPPCVIHGVRNAGPRDASFVNLPDRVFDFAAPDKFRIPPDDPRMPYRFG